MRTVIEAASPAQTLGTIECTDHACLNAISHESLCDCATCFGAGHGAAHRATRQAARDRITARIARTGDVFLGAAADIDEEW